MIDEKLFDQAVQLTAGFVANGDIRLGHSTRTGSHGFAMVTDTITGLYEQLEIARKKLSEGLDP